MTEKLRGDEIGDCKLKDERGWRSIHVMNEMVYSNCVGKC